MSYTPKNMINHTPTTLITTQRFNVRNYATSNCLLFLPNNGLKTAYKNFQSTKNQ